MNISEQIRELINSLQQKCGLSVESVETSESFGDFLLLLCNQESGVRLRVVCDRDVWFVEANGSTNIDRWYDAAILKEVVTGHVDRDILSLEEQVTFFKNNWAKVVEIFGSEDSRNRAALDQRLHDRAKRRFPKWYS